ARSEERPVAARIGRAAVHAVVGGEDQLHIAQVPVVGEGGQLLADGGVQLLERCAARVDQVEAGERGVPLGLLGPASPASSRRRMNVLSARVNVRLTKTP